MPLILNTGVLLSTVTVCNASTTVNPGILNWMLLSRDNPLVDCSISLLVGIIYVSVGLLGYLLGRDCDFVQHHGSSAEMYGA